MNRIRHIFIREKMWFILLIHFAPMTLLGQSFFKAMHSNLSYFGEKPYEKEALNVYLGNAENPILGKKIIQNDSLFFIPIVPFSPNQKYKAVYKNTVYPFELPPLPISAPLKVLAIYPLADTLPNNILKFYFEFSEPIADGQVYPKIQLYDANNQLVPEAFVNLGTELWDENRTRLTLWIDPGRVKTHLLRHESEGEVLSKNKQYHITVEPTIVSKKGSVLHTELTKFFYTTEAIREALHWKTWTVLASKDHIDINTDRLMDFGTAQKMILVFDRKSKEITGKWSFGDTEKFLRFLPEKALAKGRYYLKINTLIEDVSANNVNAAFDRNMKTQKRNNKAFVKIKVNNVN